MKDLHIWPMSAFLFQLALEISVKAISFSKSASTSIYLTIKDKEPAQINNFGG